MFAKVCIGTRAFVAERGAGAGPTAAQEARARRREEEGQTVLFVYLRALPGPEPEGGRSAGGGFLAGAVAVADVLRPETRGTVAALGRMGCECWMVTGDNPAAAAHAARLAGIPPHRVVASCLPAKKVPSGATPPFPAKKGGFPRGVAAAGWPPLPPPPLSWGVCVRNVVLALTCREILRLRARAVPCVSVP